MSAEHHLAGPCDGISLHRDGSQTTIRLRSEDEARALDYALRAAIYGHFDSGSPPPSQQTEGWPWATKFQLNQRVRKTKGSSWQGHVVGFYATGMTPIGYAVESEREPGSVQIYPEAALEAVPAATGADNG